MTSSGPAAPIQRCSAARPSALASHHLARSPIAGSSSTSVVDPPTTSQRSRSRQRAILTGTSSFLNIRVSDIQAVYSEWSARGAEFLTPPKQHETGDPLLHARPRWAPDRGRPNHPGRQLAPVLDRQLMRQEAPTHCSVPDRVTISRAIRKRRPDANIRVSNEAGLGRRPGSGPKFRHKRASDACSLLASTLIGAVVDAGLSIPAPRVATNGTGRRMAGCSYRPKSSHASRGIDVALICAEES